MNAVLRTASLCLFLLAGFCLVPSAYAQEVAPVGETPYIAKLRVAADRGDIEAQNELANAYTVGSGVPKNPVEALKWWRKSADAGNAIAQSHVGTLHYQGLGTPQDSVEAIKWWRKAAEQKNGDAEDQLGFAYLLGDGVVKSYVQAYMWFSLSASHGDKHAIKDRDSVAQYMTAPQKAEAQSLISEWSQQHP